MDKTVSLIPCLNCRSEFTGRFRTDGKQKKYCSPRCKQEHRGIVKVCRGCNAEFTSYEERKFCSWVCYENTRSVTKISYICPTCGIGFNRDASQDRRKDKDPNRKRFCSERCTGIGRRGEANPMFRGRRKAYRGTTWLEQKKRVHAMFTHCRFCEKVIEGQNRHVDHIVPWRIARLGNKDPNGDRNLWVLCRGCHAKKTHAEAILFREGRKPYGQMILSIAGRDDVRNQVNDAFLYCGIAEVKSLTVVVLRKTRTRLSGKLDSELLFA